MNTTNADRLPSHEMPVSRGQEIRIGKIVLASSKQRGGRRHVAYVKHEYADGKGGNKIKKERPGAKVLTFETNQRPIMCQKLPERSMQRKVE